MAVETKARAHPAPASDTLRIDFLFLDLTTCTRCLGADRSLASALEVVREVLEATGVEVEVGKILVESAEQARALRFVSSPTIRVDGQDVALELRESSCRSEACTDGCGDQIACRVWVHRGEQYTEPPVAMIVDAILGHVYGGAPSPGASEPEPYELPENLTRFFSARSKWPKPRRAPAVRSRSRIPAVKPRRGPTAAALRSRRGADVGECSAPVRTG
jgi:Domain of unknown function (DUF2703)